MNPGALNAGRSSSGKGFEEEKMNRKYDMKGEFIAIIEPTGKSGYGAICLVALFAPGVVFYTDSIPPNVSY